MDISDPHRRGLDIVGEAPRDGGQSPALGAPRVTGRLLLLAGGLTGADFTRLRMWKDLSLELLGLFTTARSPPHLIMLTLEQALSDRKTSGPLHTQCG